MSSPIRFLRVRVPAAGLSAAPVEWVALDATGHALERGCSLPGQLPPDTEQELVIPARLVAVHVLEVPPVAGKHEAAVIRQQLEDRVLGGMDDIHIVRGTRQGSRQTVWLVSRSWMLALLAACRTAHLAPTRVLPEQALLPASSFAETDDGFVYHASNGACGVLPDAALLEAVCGESLIRVENVLDIPATSDLNLLRGLPSIGQTARLSRPLLQAASVLLLIMAGVWLLSLILTWRQLASQETALRETIRQNFAAAHPGMPIIDPILQWRQLHGKQTAKGSDALDQLAQLAEQTAVAIRPQRLDADANALKVTLGSSDAALLKPALQAKNISFDTQTTDSGMEQIIISRSAERSQP